MLLYDLLGVCFPLSPQDRSLFLQLVFLLRCDSLLFRRKKRPRVFLFRRLMHAQVEMIILVGERVHGALERTVGTVLLAL
jgi:hypothetical protein